MTKNHITIHDFHGKLVATGPHGVIHGDPGEVVQQLDAHYHPHQAGVSFEVIDGKTGDTIIGRDQPWPGHYPSPRLLREAFPQAPRWAPSKEEAAELRHKRAQRAAKAKAKRMAAAHAISGSAGAKLLAMRRTRNAAGEKPPER